MQCNDIYSSNSTTYQFCHGESSRQWFVYALEGPNGHKAEDAIFLASSVMFVLGVLLLVLSLLGRLSGRGALGPTVRVFLYASFALFLPLTSYMFSQAKDEAKLYQYQHQHVLLKGGAGNPPRLPFRAQVILMWMLLVELLRKKVDAILAAMDSSPLRAVHQQQKLWDAIDQIVRIAWIGYLIYSYVHGLWRPGFMILWVLTLVKAAQRVAAVELAKRSFAVGRNAHLVVGYTAQIMEKLVEEAGDEAATIEQEGGGAMFLRKCLYSVMGEDRLEKEAGPEGYRVKLPALGSPDEKKKVHITVGDIWELAEGGDSKPADRLLTDHPKLKDLCLAFALFKLLHARFEDLPVDDGVAAKNRDIIFRGLCCSSTKDTAERVFHVVELELNFFMDYYHSVVPVVLSSPWFLVGNYIFGLLIVVNQSIMVLFLTGNGHAMPVLKCLARDVVAMSRRAIVLFKCLCHLIMAMFSSFNILVSFLLVLTFLLLEAWEFVVYVLSDWFLVSLVCKYARRPGWQSSRCVRRALGALLWTKRVSRRRSVVRFNQVCVLDLRQNKLWVVVSRLLPHRCLGMSSVRVPAEVKHAVFASLREKSNGEPLGTGAAVVGRRGCPQLVWACESKSVTEIILVWHIATCLFETRSSVAAPAEEARSAEETVATTLSMYCAYLVACAPELLPEDQEGSKRVYKAVKQDLRRRKRRWSKPVSLPEPVTRIGEPGNPGAAANMGFALEKQLAEKFDGNAALGWALLRELWTELLVYAAPSEKMEGHAKALAQGGEFITLLWALAIHTGISR